MSKTHTEYFETADTTHESSILNPKEEDKLPPPDKLYVYTKKYGETISTLKPGFEASVEKYERVYEIEVPEEVMNICQEINGLGGRALLVGGSVRDAVITTEHPELSLKPKDFDLEVYGLSADQLELVLTATFGRERIDSVGKAFGILKVKIADWDEPLDFSIPRRDSKTGSGHTGFAITGDPTMTIDEAALRRDLTVNSIAYDPLSKTVYDAFHGIEHIKSKKIEVTDVEAFQEDPLRVLRIMQFAARFEFGISENTKELCRQMVERGDMDELPRERIAEEIKKLFTKGIRPSIGLEFTNEIGFVERYWPELNSLKGVPQEKEWHPEGDVWTHTMQVVDAAVDVANREIESGRMAKEDKLVLVLGALTHDFGKPETTQFIEGAFRARGHEQAGVEPARQFVERIFGDHNAKDISEITKKILPMVSDHLKPKEYWENEVNKKIDQTNAIRRLSNRLQSGDKKSYPDGGNCSIYMLAMVAEADQRGRNGEDNIFLKREEVTELEEWQSWLLEKSKLLKVDQKPPEKYLTGKLFLQNAHLQEGGPWLGAILDMVYADQLDGKLSTEEEALAIGQAYLETVSSKVKEESTGDKNRERKIWENIRKMDDPREYLFQ
jgi:tRNA nucleotidyltransferase (CCA-adding enzyme)